MPDIVQKISIDVYPYDWFHISTSEDWGKTKILVTVNSELLETINWVKAYRKQLEDEAKIRAENLALASAFEGYQTMLKLVKDDHK